MQKNTKQKQSMDVTIMYKWCL